MSVSPRLLLHQAADSTGRYRAPQYEPVAGEVWHHVLYGHVPKYQMDFILRPVVPYHRLRPQHLAHLSALVKFLSPAGDDPYAFAIGNLSCDDTQHLPGRGGLAMLVGTRIPGLRDHALRDSPVFAHSLLCIDQRLDPRLLHTVAVRFKERVLGEGLSWYSSYYGVGQSALAERTLAYVRSFVDLEGPQAMDPLPVWFQDAPPLYNLIYVECGAATFEELAWYAGRMASILYRTDLRWTSISTGSEPVQRRTFGGDEYGVAIRLLRGNRRAPASVSDDPCVESGAPLRLLRVTLAELDCTDDALALLLFGLRTPQADPLALSNPQIDQVPAAETAWPLPPLPASVSSSLPVVTIEPWLEQPAAFSLSSPALQAAGPLAYPSPGLPPGAATTSQRSVALAIGSGLLGMTVGALGFWLLVDGPGAWVRNRGHRIPATPGAQSAEVALGTKAAPPASVGPANDLPVATPPPTPGLEDPAPPDPAAEEAVDLDASPPASVPRTDLIKVTSLQADLCEREVEDLNRKVLSVGAKPASVMNDERLFADVRQAEEQLREFRRLLAQAAVTPQFAARVFIPLCEATLSVRSAKRRPTQGSGGKTKPAGRVESRTTGSSHIRSSPPATKQHGSEEQQPPAERKNSPGGSAQSASQ